ncbi:MAG: FkbM family methyltransferase [Candidatus Poribacteria bacterium]|nr:FkbM family methyltransferase [Candidatus Poribacteria bacterium]
MTDNRIDLLVDLYSETEWWRSRLRETESGSVHQEDGPVAEVTTPFNFTLKGPSHNIVYWSPQRYFLYGGPWPSYESFLILTLTYQGGTFLDLGANVGHHSLLAAVNTASSIAVHAFEPSSIMHSFLVENIRANKMQRRITPYHLAVGDRRTETTFHVAGFASSLNEKAAKIGPTGNTHHTETVQVYPLDDLFHPSDLAAPLIVKIDTEGFEWQVVQGAERLFRDPVTFAVILETESPSAGPNALNALNALNEWGFECRGLAQSSANNPYAEDSRLVPFEECSTDDDAWPHYWLCLRRGHPMRDLIDQMGTLFQFHWTTRFMTNQELSALVKKMVDARESL